MLVIIPVAGLALLSIALAGEKQPSEPPVEFLQTDNPAAKRALATKITAEFRGAPIWEVIGYLGRAGQINTVLKLDADSKIVRASEKQPKVARNIPGAPVEADPPAATSAFKNQPKITRKFEGVPLRTVYCQLSRDSGLKIVWMLGEKKFPVGILIRNR